MSAVGAAALFYIYAILNGLTLSVIFLVYTQGIDRHAPSSSPPGPSAR